MHTVIEVFDLIEILNGDVAGVIDVDKMTGGIQAIYYIDNRSANGIHAENNTFPDDEDLLDCKIYDKADKASSGVVDIDPFIPSATFSYQLNPPMDMTEPTYVWDAYYFVEDATPTTVTWDSTDKITGDASLFWDTDAGFDVIMHYFPEPGKIAAWDVNDTGAVEFWCKINITDPTNLWGVQEAFIRVGNACGGYYQYTNTSGTNALNASINNWKKYSIPLQGDAIWARTIVGNPSFGNISYIEMNIDVWQWGYEAWLDSLTISYNHQSATDEPPLADNGYRLHQNIPNPFKDETMISFTIPNSEQVQLRIMDSVGREIALLVDEKLEAGYHEVSFSNKDLPPGVYYYTLRGENTVMAKQMVVLGSRD